MSRNWYTIIIMRELFYRYSTLHRFYSLHYTLPFILFMLVILHFALLHEFGSSNGLGIHAFSDNIPFIPYYGLKDGFSIIITLFLFFLFVIIAPDKLGHSDNFILANALVTPTHIVPEWYFLPLYAILRSVTNKLLGIFLIACAIVCILSFPFFCKGFIIRSATFRPIYNFLVWIFSALCYSSGWIGSLPVLREYFVIGLIVTISYFVFFMLLSVISLFEKLIFHINNTDVKIDNQKEQRLHHILKWFTAVWQNSILYSTCWAFSSEKFWKILGVIYSNSKEKFWKILGVIYSNLKERLYQNLKAWRLQYLVLCSKFVLLYQKFLLRLEIFFQKKIYLWGIRIKYGFIYQTSRSIWHAGLPSWGIKGLKYKWNWLKSRLEQMKIKWNSSWLKSRLDKIKNKF